MKGLPTFFGTPREKIRQKHPRFSPFEGIKYSAAPLDSRNFNRFWLLFDLGGDECILSGKGHSVGRFIYTHCTLDGKGARVNKKVTDHLEAIANNN